MHNTALVGECHVGTDEHVLGDGLAEDFDTEDISNDFFGLALQVGMYKGYVIIGDDNVAKGRKAFFYPLKNCLELLWQVRGKGADLYLDGIWETVTQMLEFLVGCACGY